MGKGLCWFHPGSARQLTKSWPKRANFPSRCARRLKGDHLQELPANRCSTRTPKRPKVIDCRSSRSGDELQE